MTVTTVMSFVDALSTSQLTGVTNEFCTILATASGKTPTCTGVATTRRRLLATSYTFSGTFEVAAADVAAFSTKVEGTAFVNEMQTSVAASSVVTAANRDTPITSIATSAAVGTLLLTPLIAYAHA